MTGNMHAPDPTCSSNAGHEPAPAEDIVRRATAAFNAGQPDEAHKLCEQGLAPRARRSHAEPSAGGGAVFQSEIAAARAPIEASLAKRPDNAAAHLLAARIARAAKDFEARLAHLDRAIAIAPQREHFSKRRARWTRPG